MISNHVKIGGKYIKLPITLIHKNLFSDIESDEESLKSFELSSDLSSSALKYTRKLSTLVEINGILAEISDIDRTLSSNLQRATRISDSELNYNFTQQSQSST